MSDHNDIGGLSVAISRKYSFDRDGVPLMLNWTIKDVGDWVKIDLGFPEYEDCFVLNFINGRKLILIDASSLQKLGVQDFAHIKVTTHIYIYHKLRRAIVCETNCHEFRDFYC